MRSFTGSVCDNIMRASGLQFCLAPDGVKRHPVNYSNSAAISVTILSRTNGQLLDYDPLRCLRIGRAAENGCVEPTLHNRILNHFVAPYSSGTLSYICRRLTTFTPVPSSPHLVSRSTYSADYGCVALSLAYGVIRAPISVLDVFSRGNRGDW